MKEFIIGNNEAGQRFDKYLHKLLKDASAGFLYKMLRKKNIVLNDKKASGTEILAVGDRVKLFLSEDTFIKFQGAKQLPSANSGESTEAINLNISIIYEDPHILLCNKPVGILSQKAKPEDVSANEWLITYLNSSGQLTEQQMQTFRPSVCNRLDRNTSGLLICGKSLAGLQKMNQLLAERELHKYYRCLVKGRLAEDFTLNGYLKKDETTNKVTLKPVPFEGADEIRTGFRSLAYFEKEDYSFLEIELITGKPHQIRAHLASVSHPVLGDYKYGDRRWNDIYKKKYGIKSQLLHAYRLVFPQMGEPFTALSGKEFIAPWPHGIPEDSEGPH